MFRNIHKYHIGLNACTCYGQNDFMITVISIKLFNQYF